MSSAGAIVWISVRPLIRLFINVGAGFALTKADLFPVVAARGAGQIILNIALPCLMFSRIVPAFTSQNIHNLGPLVLVAIIYEALGMALAWLVTQFFWVPHRFRYGILVAGAFGNVGDIPTSVIMSITASAPFSGAQDQNLAVAYIAAFILVFFITLFPMGGHRLIMKDYVGPDIEPEDVREMMRLRHQKLVSRILSNPLTHRRRTVQPVDDLESASEKNVSYPEKSGEAEITEELRKQAEQLPPCQQDEKHRSHEKHVAFIHDEAASPADMDLASHLTSPAPTITHVGPSRMTSPTPTITYVDDAAPRALPIEPTPSANPRPSSSESAVLPPVHPHRSRILSEAHAVLRGLLNPSSLAIIVAFPIALITPLKALFTPPPLAFLLDTASFIGAASGMRGIRWGDAMQQLGAQSSIRVDAGEFKEVITAMEAEGLVKVVGERDKRMIRRVEGA
ncbi:hypothetical protein EWM64_g7491 [Hericium alpestre]|uniref:Auxin efflux carrier n=1 Tax=Hericium alpestre TaxID=135208 RepID=A0A4Y9ZSQ8_9AGAM|nr:hypothetical protein EWM64_g7491 [Hericium alpestre]